MREPDGFREFVAARQRSLLRSVWLLTGDWGLAQDLVQLGLTKVWTRWDRLWPDGDPEAYARAVAFHAFVRRRRRERHLSAVPVRERVDERDAYAVAEARDEVVRLLRELPARQRAVVVLRYYEDLSEVETARILGCSVGNVKSQASRALARLRGQLAGDVTPGGPT